MQRSGGEIGGGHRGVIKASLDVDHDVGSLRESMDAAHEFQNVPQHSANPGLPENRMVINQPHDFSETAWRFRRNAKKAPPCLRSVRVTSQVGSRRETIEASHDSSRGS